MHSIIILSNDFIFTTALTSLITDSSNRHCNVLTASSTAELCSLISTVKKANFVIDMGGYSYYSLLQIIRKIRARAKNPCILTIADDYVDNKNHLFFYIYNTSDIMINKFDSLSRIRNGLRKLHHSDTDISGITVSTSVVQPDTTHSATSVRSDITNALTEREIQILNCIISGQSPIDISQTLYISKKTVYSHKLRIYGKLGVRNLKEFHSLLKMAYIL